MNFTFKWFAICECGHCIVPSYPWLTGFSDIISNILIWMVICPLGFRKFHFLFKYVTAQPTAIRWVKYLIDKLASNKQFSKFQHSRFYCRKTIYANQFKGVIFQKECFRLWLLLYSYNILNTWLTGLLGLSYGSQPDYIVPLRWILRLTATMILT